VLLFDRGHYSIAYFSALIDFASESFIWMNNSSWRCSDAAAWNDNSVDLKYRFHFVMTRLETKQKECWWILKWCFRDPVRDAIEFSEAPTHIHTHTHTHAHTHTHVWRFWEMYWFRGGEAMEFQWQWLVKRRRGAGYRFSLLSIDSPCSLILDVSIDLWARFSQGRCHDNASQLPLRIVSLHLRR